MSDAEENAEYAREAGDYGSKIMPTYITRFDKCDWCDRKVGEARRRCPRCGHKVCKMCWSDSDDNIPCCNRCITDRDVSR